MEREASSLILHFSQWCWLLTVLCITGKVLGQGLQGHPLCGAVGLGLPVAGHSRFQLAPTAPSQGITEPLSHRQAPQGKLGCRRAGRAEPREQWGQCCRKHHGWGGGGLKALQPMEEMSEEEDKSEEEGGGKKWLLAAPVAHASPAGPMWSHLAAVGWALGGRFTFLVVCAGLYMCPLNILPPHPPIYVKKRPRRILGNM